MFIKKTKKCHISDSMYAKFGDRYCKNYYGIYRTLDEATFACSGDENCEKVYHVDCTGHVFYLCSWNSTEPRSSKRSCIYKKLGKYGNRFPIKSIL